MAENSSHPTDSPVSSAEHIEDVETFEKLITSEDRVLVDFYADWCGPCQMMAPIVDELAAETDSPVVKIDVEQLPQIATRYDVHGIPAFIVFDNGEVTEHLIGVQEKETLAQSLE